MENKYIVTRYNDELQHHGIKGQKWGIRRFQNKDGSLTPRGRQRYEKVTIDGQTYRVEGRDRSKAADEAVRRAREQGFEAYRYTSDDKRSKVRQVELEQQYIKLGYPKDVAQKQAQRVVKGEKFVTAMYMTTIGISAAIGIAAELSKSR